MALSMMEEDRNKFAKDRETEKMIRQLLEFEMDRYQATAGGPQMEEDE